MKFPAYKYSNFAVSIKNISDWVTVSICRKCTHWVILNVTSTYPKHDPIFQVICALHETTFGKEYNVDFLCAVTLVTRSTYTIYMRMHL